MFSFQHVILISQQTRALSSLPPSYYSPLSLMFPGSYSSSTLTSSPASMTPLPDSTVQMPEDEANTETEASSQLSFKPSSSNRSVYKCKM